MNDQTRSERQLLPPIESILKQMDTAGTELECFQALQKQEQLAATHRINGLWEEVQKQKELEQTLQRRFGNLVAELERIQHLIADYRTLAKQQEEIAARNCALELAESAAKQAAMQNSETSEPMPSDDVGSSAPVDSSKLEISEQQINAAQEHMHASLKQEGTNADSQNKHAPMDTDASLSTDVPSVVEELHAARVPKADENNKDGVPANYLINQGDDISDVVVVEGNKLKEESVNVNASDIKISTDVIRDDAVAEDQQILMEITKPDGVVTKGGLGEDERSKSTYDEVNAVSSE